MKKNIPPFLFSSIFFIALSFSVQISSVFAENNDSPNVVLTKDLRLTMNDPEIVHLQQVLNASGFATVSVVGAGSKGSETSYFGLKTQQAVIKFQEAFASEILAPIGLTQGTGFVGAKTRAKMNELWSNNYFFSYYGIVLPANTTVNTDTSTNTDSSNQDNTNNANNTFNNQGNFSQTSSTTTVATSTSATSTATTTKTTTASTTKTISGTAYGSSNGYRPGKTITDLLGVWSDPNNKVKVYEVNPSQAKRGDEILVAGSGFTSKDNTIKLRGKSKNILIKGVESKTSNELTFILPQGAEYGTSTVSVSNSAGTSREDSVKSIELIVSATTTCATVCVDSVDQKGHGLSTEFIVKGSGFTDSKNLVMSRFGPIGMYDSEKKGTIINIKLIESGVILNALPNLSGKIDFPIIVANKNGFSKFFTVTVSMP